MKDILSQVSKADDVKKLDSRELYKLSDEIRQFMIKSLSKTGGHLASNLGVVELTLALHKVFESPKDKLIWDVGHQTYVHKIITGRKEKFDTIRQYKGLSGFPKRNESIHDTFETGHSSTSISAGLGFALSRDIKKEDYHVVSIIGDGAMTAGMAFEALNHAGDIKTNLIVVLNDNEMSISENVGGLSHYLNKLRTEPTYFKVKKDVEHVLCSIPSVGKKVFKTAERAKDSVKYFFVPGMLFEDLGFKYLGPIDGHNIDELINVFNRAKKVKGPVLVHILTKKGKGYKPAELNPDKYHSAAPFVIETGETKKKSSDKKYSEIFGDTLVELAKDNEKIVAITAAMPAGTGLCKFKKQYPKRFFDVGIAEQHGVTLAAGFAANGLKPFFVVYSTFLQRGYDQVIHDVCIQNLPVVFAIDRAGLVGADGETHQGVFDYSFLSNIPNMTMVAPKDEEELKKMIKFSLTHNGPIAIRYPRGNSCNIETMSVDNEIELGKSEILKEGKNIAIIAIGKMVEYGVKVSEILEKDNIDITLINGRFIKPLDKKMISKVARKHKLIITLEDNIKIGGFGSNINDVLIKNNFSGEVINIGIPDKFVEHGNVEKLFIENGMDEVSIAKLIKEKVKL